MGRILVVEDEVVIRGELKRVLARAGHDVQVAGDVPAAERLGPDSFDLVLTDLRLPGPSGDALIEKAEGVPVIVMTAHGTVRSAVDAMKRGAVDYLSKPFDPEELLLIVQRALASSRRERRAQALDQDVARAWQVEGLVGQCPAMQRVREWIERAGPSDATVLILGESGSGKELVARALHARSPRADAPFVAVNCASIPEGLVESELFGHERGAFTGADRSRKGLFRAAHGGTLFLDEVGELPLSAQARLLRVLQEKEVRPVGSTRAVPVDARIVAATHRDLPARVQQGGFRQDLYYRLRVVELALPPLRDRGEDRMLLARALLDRAARRAGRAGLSLSGDAARAIEAYRWPGNVRELENAIERALILHDEGPVDAELLGLPAQIAEPEPPLTPSGEALSMEAYFVHFVTEHQGQMSETELARALGISRKTLWQRRGRLGIPRPK